MKKQSYLDKFAEGFTPKRASKKSQEWFFQDIDMDGVMNGVDCKPYDRKRQDSFITPSNTYKLVKPFISSNHTKLYSPIQSKVYTNYITNATPNLRVIRPFPKPVIVPRKAPQTKLKILPLREGNNNPKQRVPIPYNPKVVKSDSFGNLYTLKNNAPQSLSGNPLNVIKSGNKTVVYDSGIRREFSNPVSLGVNQDNIKALQKIRKPLYVEDNPSKTQVAGNALKYIKEKNIELERVPKNSKLLQPNSRAMYNPTKNKIIIRDTNRDENVPLIHEVGHAVNRDQNSKYRTFDNQAYQLYDQNKFRNPIRDSNLYALTRASGKTAIANEAKSYYLDEYYRGNVQKNEIVDAFEKRLGVKQPEQPKMSIKEVVMAGNAVAEGTQKIMNIQKSQLPTFKRPIGWRADTPPALNPGYRLDPYTKTIPIRALRDKNTIAKVPGNPTRSYNPYYTPIKGKSVR